MSMGGQKPGTGGARRRVLIVDDHPVTRQGLKGLILQSTDLEVCGEAATVQAALECVAHLHPNVAIVDISLKGESGIDLIKDIRARYPDLPVLTLSMHDEAIYAEEVLRAGALGYSTKEEAAGNLLNGIRQVLSGQVFLSERMSAKMLSKTVGRRAEAPGLSIDRLSEREMEVFQLIGQGLTTRKIAESLQVSTKTVESHRASIKQKLQLDSATELAQHAIHWMQSRK